MIIYEVEKKNDSNRSFTGLVRYLTNSKGIYARVGEINFQNFLAEEVNVACIEATAIQMMNTRSTSDKTLHLIMSFPAGEKPSSEVLKDCEAIVVKELGMEEYQRLSVVHGDTDHFHLHIVINKIHPKTKNILEPYQSYTKLAKACVICEDKYNLSKDNHEFIRPSVENRIDKIEIHRGEESLCSAVRRIKEELTKANDWETFHDILKRNNCGIKIKANGFVFYDQNGIQVKASTVDRIFSKKKLEDKFGAFIPFDDQIKNKKESAEKCDFDATSNEESVNEQMKKEKRAAENFNNDREKSLWSEYQKIRNESYKYNKQIKKEVYEFLSKMSKDAYKKIKLKYKIFSMLKIPRFMRSYLIKSLCIEARQKREDIKTASKIKLEKLVGAQQSWLSFLQKKAENGNLDALNILLRRNSQNIGHKSSELTKANDNFSMLKSAIEKYSKFEKITSNGNRIYSFKNKTIVVSADRIYVNSRIRGKDYKFKKSKNSKKFRYAYFDRTVKNHGFKYSDFKSDYSKAEKIYEYVNEEFKNLNSKNYQTRTTFAKLKNRKFMSDHMRSYRNKQVNQNHRRGRTI